MLGRFEDAGKIPRSSRAGLRTSGKITTTNPRCRLLVVIFTGDGRSHHHALWRQIQRGYSVSGVREVQELWASEAFQWPGATPYSCRSCLCRESHHKLFPGGEASTLIDLSKT